MRSALRLCGVAAIAGLLCFTAPEASAQRPEWRLEADAAVLVADNVLVTRQGGTITLRDAASGSEQRSLWGAPIGVSGIEALAARMTGTDPPTLDIYAHDGRYLHHWRVDDPFAHRDWTPFAGSTSRDLRRGECATDSVIAPPLPTQAGYRSVVIIGTAHGCGDTRNQIIALNAHDITAPPVWVFNDGEHQLGAVNNCTADEASGSVICVSTAGAPGQATVWQIDAASGALRWQAAVGSVADAPAIGFAADGAKRVYAANQDGTLFALEFATGALAWQSSRPFGFRGSTSRGGIAIGAGDLAGYVFSVRGGVLVALVDRGSHPFDEWSSPILPRFVSAPLVHEATGRVFALGDDQRLYQLDARTGRSQASIEIGPFRAVGGVVAALGNTPPSLIVSTDGWTTSGNVARVCVPIIEGVQDSACGPAPEASDGPDE